jgi:hypothetical protein
MSTQIGTIRRYTVEFRDKPGDPWQEAEPHLARDDRYPAEWGDAVAAVDTLEDQDKSDGRTCEYRISTVEFDAAEWEDMA